MDNYSNYNNSYTDSRDSTPRSSRDQIDCENASWDEPPSSSSSSNYKVKFMCSYGGKILPRSHDNQLAYVGGDTKILAVDRSIRFSGIISKLSALCDFDAVCFKYQLPGEDLDALISVTNEEDLEHMMIEYDRLLRASPKPARLRLFLFPVNPPSAVDSPTSFTGEDERKPNQQWFVDALNSVPAGALDVTSLPSTGIPPAGAGSNPDFLFGLEQKAAPLKHEIRSESPVAEPVPVKIPPVGSDLGRDDHHHHHRYIGGGGEGAVSPAEIQRQIQELQRLQIANHEQAMFQRKTDEMLARAFPGDYYVQQKAVPVAEKSHQPGMPVPVPAIPAPATVTVPAPYWQEQRHVGGGGGGGTGGGYQVAHTGPVSDQPVYLIPGPGPNMFHQQQLQQQQQQPGPRQMGTGPAGYYGVQRMVPQPQQDHHVYREQQVYGGHNMGPPPAQQQLQQNIVRSTPPPPVGESGYATQVAYDSMGRQVFYTGGAQVSVVAPPPASTAAAAAAASSYLNHHQQGNVVTVDARQPQQVLPPLQQQQQQQQVAAGVEGSKVIMKPPSQASV